MWSSNQRGESGYMALSAAQVHLDAGRAAAQFGSVAEAVREFKLGVASAERASDGEMREQLLFELNMNLGPALMAETGYTSTDALAAFLQARKRLHLSRSSMEQVHVFLGLFNVHFGRGELERAFEVAEQADQALSVGYAGYPVLLGQTLCMMGRFLEARARLSAALAKYDPSLDAESGLFARVDVVATVFLAKTEFALGDYSRAAELTVRAKQLAHDQDHPIAQALAYMGEMFLASEAGDLTRAKTIADEALAHATQNGLSNYRRWIAFHCAALGMRSDPTGAIAAMVRLLAESEAEGTRMFRAGQLGLLGVAHASIGRHVEALFHIDDGIRTANEALNMESMPALYRLRARTLLVMQRPEEALLDVEAALRMAQSQSALTDELRSAIMLVGIHQNTSQRETSRGLLAATYARFEKGVGLPDLKYAERLLASSDNCA
jgi:tetratricopeptide (TPR) repeat protein